MFATLTAVLFCAAEVIFVVSVGVSGGTGVTADRTFPLPLQHTRLNQAEPEAPHSSNTIDHFLIATMIKSCGHIPFYRRWRAAWRAGWWEGPSQWVSALSVWTCSEPWCSALLEARHWPSPGRQKTASLVFTTQKCSGSLKEAVILNLTLWRASTCKSWNSDVSSLIEWLARMTDRTPKPWCLMKENTLHLLTHLFTYVIFVII